MSDPDQVRLDLEDAQLRLANLRRAIQRRDQAEADVRRLAQFLRQAKRRLKEAGWDLSTLLAAERRS